MSIVQAIMGVVQAAPEPPYYYLNVSGYNEGTNIDVTVYYGNVRNQVVYWSLLSDSATVGTDFTSSNGTSGYFLANGSGGHTITTLTVAADNTTEGGEYYIVCVGTYSGGQDLISQSCYINDTSVAPRTNFTIEWWQNMNSSQPGSYPRLFDVNNYSNEKPGISFEGGNTVMIWNGGTRDTVVTTFLYNEWVHWAIVRNNNTMALYKNGTNILSSNNIGTLAFDNTTNSLTLGWGSNQYWNGKIAGFHWVKGTAKYTSNFTPLKAPPTVLTNSKYLLNVVDEAGKLSDSTGNHTYQAMSGTVAFSTDSPWYYAAVTNSLLGVGNTLGVFNTPYPLGWSNIKPGWTIDRVGGGYSSTVVSFDGGSQIVAADNWPNDGASYTFTPPTVQAFSSACSGSAGTYHVLFQSTDTVLANVKSGWTITDGAGWNDVVTMDAYISSGYYQIAVAGSVLPPNGSTYTFAPPTQTGSLVFSNSYVTIANSSDWAFDA